MIAYKKPTFSFHARLRGVRRRRWAYRDCTYTPAARSAITAQSRLPNDSFEMTISGPTICAALRSSPLYRGGITRALTARATHKSKAKQVRKDAPQEKNSRRGAEVYIYSARARARSHIRALFAWRQIPLACSNHPRDDTENNCAPLSRAFPAALIGSVSLPTPTLTVSRRIASAQAPYLSSVDDATRTRPIRVS